jgi:hypothetical protein
MRARCLVHSILFDLMNNAWWKLQIMKLLIIPLYPVFSLAWLLGPSILSILFSKHLQSIILLILQTKLHTHKTKRKKLAFK